MKNYNGLCERSYHLSKEKGWYETERSLSEAMMLMVSEVAEATEEVRKGTPLVYQHDISNLVTPFDTNWDLKVKPEGELIELADCVIRIADTFGHNKWDLEKELSTIRTIKGSKSDWLSHFRVMTPLEQHMGVVATISYGLTDGVPRHLALAVAKIEAIHEARSYKVPFDIIIDYKHEYNKTRPHRHGGKLL